MARNRLAGTKVGKSKSAKYYQNNPESKKRNRITIPSTMNLQSKRRRELFYKL